MLCLVCLTARAKHSATSDPPPPSLCLTPNSGYSASSFVFLLSQTTMAPSGLLMTLPTIRGSAWVNNQRSTSFKNIHGEGNSSVALLRRH